MERQIVSCDLPTLWFFSNHHGCTGKDFTHCHPASELVSYWTVHADWTTHSNLLMPFNRLLLMFAEEDSCIVESRALAAKIAQYCFRFMDEKSHYYVIKDFGCPWRDICSKMLIRSWVTTVKLMTCTETWPLLQYRPQSRQQQTVFGQAIVWDHSAVVRCNIKIPLDTFIHDRKGTKTSERTL